MAHFEAFKYYAYEESVIVQPKAFTIVSEKTKCEFYTKYYLNNILNRQQTMYLP